MFDVSACAWCLTGEPPEPIARLRSAGFDLVDLRPDCWTGIRDRAHLAELGISLSCAGITPVQMAPGLSLETLATPDAGRAAPYFAGALRRGAALGAKWAYMVTPRQRCGESPEYVRSISRLGEEAGKCGLKLCIEPHPGRALSNYTEVMRFLDTARSPHLYALLDLGHMPLAGEDIPVTVRMLGDRIGYVHVDSNDGLTDSHFGLLDGTLKPSALYAFFEALAATSYSGPLAIELSNSLRDPVSSLVASRDFIAAWSGKGR